MKLQHPYLIDTTLRDGEQTPGVVFSRKEKLHIASLLQELNIQEIEAGTPCNGYEERAAIKEIAKAGFTFRTSCWCRATIDDIRQAILIGTDSINLSLPVSSIQMETLGKTRKWIIQQAIKSIKFAGQYFSHVTMGAQDASRAEPDFLHEFIFFAADAGANRIRFSDTVGILDPIETSETIKRLKTLFAEVEFEFHGHNDLGMATANSITALNSGAQCVSGTINGIGERAGNAALEEIIAYLYFKKKQTQFNTSVTTLLCNLVAGACNAEISKQKPVVGAHAFVHESGIHTSAMLKNPYAYQALVPADFGRDKHSFAIGKHSGKASIMNYYLSKNLKINEVLAQIILTRIKTITAENKKKITDDELLLLYHELSKECKQNKNTSFVNGTYHEIYDQNG